MQEEIGVSYMANAMKSSAAINHEKMGYVTDIKETDWQKCEWYGMLRRQSLASEEK
jgi:hypothetical protein